MLGALHNLAKNGTSSKGAPSNSEELSSRMQGTRFEEMLRANPYNQTTRQQSFWEKVLSGLGFRTAYDKDMDQLAQSSAEYQAQVAQLASEDAYNSPIQQAQRMRQAGLNPDLTGLSGEPASEFDNQQASPEFAGAEFPELLSGFQNLSSLVLGSLGTASSIMQSIGTTTQLVQNLRNGSLDQANKIVDTVRNLHKVILGDESVNGNNVDFNPSSSPLMSIIPNRAMRRKVSKYLVEYNKSLQKYSDTKNAQTQVQKERQEYNSLLGSATYSDSDSVMQGLFKILSDGQYQASKEMYRMQKEQSKYSADVAEGMNSNGSASAEASAYLSDQGTRTAENDFRKEQFEVQKSVMDTYQKALDFLHKKAQEGDLLSAILSFVLGNMSVDWKTLLGGMSAGPLKSGYNMIKKPIDWIRK